jgi:hypothetical protein
MRAPVTTISCGWGFLLNYPSKSINSNTNFIGEVYDWPVPTHRGNISRLNQVSRLMTIYPALFMIRKEIIEEETGMSNEPNQNNTLKLPKDLVPLLTEGVCEYASLKKDGTPITSPVIPFPGMAGRTIDVQTGLTYPTKAERARNNPKVCLLYSEPNATLVDNPPIILVYGQATVYDADLQANTDRYVNLNLTRFKMFRPVPGFILRQMDGYLARIWIAVTPLKILWWPEGNLEASPQQWFAPKGVQAPPSDPPPKPLPAPHKSLVDPSVDWQKDMAYAIDNLGSPILTVVDQEGYPLPFRVRASGLRKSGVNLVLPATFPTNPNGRACLTFHKINLKNGEMVSNENMSFVGEVSEQGSGFYFKVDRCLPIFSAGRDPASLVSLVANIFRMGKRLEVEAARRNQPVPQVRLPHEYSQS